MSGVLALQTTPAALLRARPSLQAAEACVKRAGRPERHADLCDAVHFLRPGDLPGPAGETYLSWWRASENPVTIKILQRALPEMSAEDLAVCLNAGCVSGASSPIARAAATLDVALRHKGESQVVALILAQDLQRRHLVPLLTASLSSKDLKKSRVDLRLGCYQAVTQGALQASSLAVDLFLARDLLAPAELSHLMSDRAARRICDRLVDIGGVRELTERETFRLYGV